MSDVIIVNTDGGTRGNPGPSAWGFVVTYPNGEKFHRSGFLESATNNEAEYQAMIQALEWIIKFPPPAKFQIRSDSQLVVRQLLGEYACRVASLRPFYLEALSYYEAIQNLGNYELRLAHVPREENAEADQLCNAEMDARGAKFIKRGPKS